MSSPPAAQDPDDPAALPLPESLPPTYRPVLIVEDQASVRALLSDLLAIEGITVVEACHGQEALELLQAGLRPRSILLDLMMPVMDGWEFLRRLRHDPAFQAVQTLPVLVMSGAGEFGGTVEQLANAVMSKPINLTHLLEFVAACPP